MILTSENNGIKTFRFEETMDCVGGKPIKTTVDVHTVDGSLCLGQIEDGEKRGQYMVMTPEMVKELYDLVFPKS